MAGEEEYEPTQTFDDGFLLGVPPANSSRPWAVLQRSSDNREFELCEGLSVIGRDKSAAVSFPGNSIFSRRHAEIELRPFLYSICDKGSRNKTRRGRAVLVPDVKYELKNGDIISFGNIQFVFKTLRIVEEAVDEEVLQRMSTVMSDDEDGEEVDDDGNPVDLDDLGNNGDNNEREDAEPVDLNDIPATCVFDDGVFVCNDDDNDEEGERKDEAVKLDDLPETCVFDDVVVVANDENANISSPKKPPNAPRAGLPTTRDYDDDSDVDIVM